MKVVKVTYHYEDGSIKEFTKEVEAWNEMWNIDWVKEGKQTKKEKEQEWNEVKNRLNNIDPAIFPENLFEEQ